jgi:hypothetical protein
VAGTRPPERGFTGDFSSVSMTTDETSIVCDEVRVSKGIEAEKGIGIVAVSTFGTDHVLVASHSLDEEVAALRSAGRAVVAHE